MYGGIGHYFVTTLKRLANKDRLEVALPYLINDVHASLDKWASADSSIIEPFDDMWQLVYQLTHRTLGCHDIAEDPKLLLKTLTINDYIIKSSAMEIMFPWLPVPTRVMKLWASARLAWIIMRLAEKRRKSGEQVDDMMQVLINQNHENLKIAAASLSAVY